RLLIAVADDAIAYIAGELLGNDLADGIVLHTSGSAGPDALVALRQARNSVGVLHPLQTVPSADRGVKTLPGSTFAFAGDPAAAAWAQDLIRCLGGKA